MLIKMFGNAVNIYVVKILTNLETLEFILLIKRNILTIHKK